MKIKILLSIFNVRFPKWTISIKLWWTTYLITKTDLSAEEIIFIACRITYHSCKWNEHNALKRVYYFQNNIYYTWWDKNVEDSCLKKKKKICPITKTFSSPFANSSSEIWEENSLTPIGVRQQHSFILHEMHWLTWQASAPSQSSGSKREQLRHTYTVHRQTYPFFFKDW